MIRFKLALAGLATVGAALVAAPEPAKAGGLSISVGLGHPGYYGYGYRPVRYGYYHRPYVRRVVYGYPRHYHRPYVRRVVYGYPRYYHRPVVRRVVYRSYPRYYHRPVVRRVVYRSYPRYYHRPVVRRVVYRSGYYGRPHHRGYYRRGWW